MPSRPDEAAIAEAVTALLIAVGEDPQREGLQKTPQRVAGAWAEMLDGYQSDPLTHLQTTFCSEHNDLVVVRDIQFESVCEHHLLPFRGVAQVGYIPNNGAVVGLSKLSRLVNGYAHRLQLQEKLTNQIADAIEEALHPLGVAVLMRAEHTCMSVRGVHDSASDTVTITGRGALKSSGSYRQEFLRLVDSAGRGGNCL